MELAGKKALVLGATGGLGTQITKNLVSNGMDVFAVSKSQAKLEQLASETSVAGSLALDLRDSENVARAFTESRAALGELAIVINAVGVVAFGSVEELSIDAMEELFMVNSFLPIAVAQNSLTAVSPGGVVVNISGVIAEENFPGMAAYGASKAAGRSFWEGFGKEARRKKILALDARPPHTETGLADRAVEGAAPKFPQGLTPQQVAGRIVKAIVGDETDLPSGEFG